MVREGFASIETTTAQAEGLLAQGRYEEAERHYRDLIGQTHVIDYEYDDWLRHLADIYRVLGRTRAAGYVYLYLHYFDLARDAFGDEGGAEKARVLEVEKRWSEAAELYARAQLPVHAAVAWERAKQPERAAATWERLLGESALKHRPYEQALVHFNYGMARAAIGEEGAAGKRALVEAQRRLEHVADDYETRGERERAFDCYQILLKLGRDSGQFENLAEGYLNCIRVLKDDGLKFYVLQYYEDFIRLALQRGELHAAATLFQEAADYAVRSGLPYDRHYQGKAAETWVRCAERHRKDGAPVEMIENALLAGIRCYSAVGQYEQVKKLFETLGELPLAERKAKRYAAIAERYEAAESDGQEAPEFPEYLKQQHAYADIWFVDLIEWELGGDAFGVAASIAGDLRYPDGIRRRALVIVLTLEDAAARGEEREPDTLAQVAELLGELQSYAALSPLERLFEHEESEVRRAAVRALRFLYFKRSFVLVRRALQDADESVRGAALEAVGGLSFPHALGPLSRIYREADDAHTKTAAIEAVGRIQSVEAGEFLLMVLRQEEDPLRDAAKQALATLDNPDVLPILRQHHQVEGNPAVRDVLAELLRAARMA